MLNAYKKIGNAYAVAMGKELLKQGREARSGGLINSLKSIVNGSTISILGNSYWTFVNYGVQKGKINPKAPARIKGLIKWLKYKGIGSSEPIIRGIAYAIAYTHFKKGMPTMNGRLDKSRLNFVDKAIKNSEREISMVIDKEIGYELDLILKKF